MLSISSVLGKALVRNVNMTNDKLKASLFRLSSGYRITQPSDDIVGYVRSNSMKSRNGAYKIIKSNLEDYNSMLNTANSVAGEISTLLTTMKEKAQLSELASTSDSERASLDVEYQNLRDSVDNIVNSAEFNDSKIMLDGIGFNAAQEIFLTPESDSAIAISFDLAPLDVGATGSAGIELTSQSIDSTANATLSMADLDNSIDKVNGFMAETSGLLLAVEAQINVTDTIVSNHEAAQSNIMEVDIAEELAEYTALDIKKQAGVAVIAQANISQRSMLTLFESSFA